MTNVTLSEAVAPFNSQSILKWPTQSTFTMSSTIFIKTTDVISIQWTISNSLAKYYQLLMFLRRAREQYT